MQYSDSDSNWGTSVQVRSNETSGYVWVVHFLPLVNQKSSLWPHLYTSTQIGVKEEEAEEEDTFRHVSMFTI